MSAAWTMTAARKSHNGCPEMTTPPKPTQKEFEEGWFEMTRDMRTLIDFGEEEQKVASH